MSQPIAEFKQSQPLTLGVELELQLLSVRDFDLTRGATDLLGSMDYDGRFGEIKLEITESMIEVSTLPRTLVDGIAADLVGLRQALVNQCARNHIAVCGGGTHPFHRWSERRICPGDRFDEIYHRYGYLAKQFTVFGQHIHVGCSSGDDAIWLTQALGAYVPVFIALSASSPFVDGEDTLFQSARLNAVSAFPLSGQCPALRDWAEFIEHFSLLQACGIARSIKDLYWDIRPKPEFGTVEIRICDTPLTVERAAALAALAQSLVRRLLRTRPVLNTQRQLHVARYNKFQACRYGFDAQISDPIGLRQVPLRQIARELLAALAEDARELGCCAWLELLDASLASEISDARWLRRRQAIHGNLNDVVREAAMRFGKNGGMNFAEETR
ncbi:YbdK family carboxylate-amine ligase [Accumulibacter sp.]|jgi:carboxylate-amine ligase|uniref:YbdK family carboxylate-amine ligase n=1 Tax=Accumulibacter sp. TaxID=2053492 RepID=UPI001AD1F394|nr:YbdK family carboxylate-amine ligase [Accumulibacter sp.]MBN8452376.1 glutamate--cysteine ligase [Accumulibacter sp.]MBO3707894.1 glutamate--cysteine ligase [Candidatus Accumulibacter conexus]